MDQVINSIYIHIPFCKKKCHYCDFYSIENLGGIERFNNTLIKEINLSVRHFDKSGWEIGSIFFGGGTPSLLNLGHFDGIFDLIYSTFKVASDCEITVECNPGTVDLVKLSGLKSIGVNRLSMGIQSFIPAELDFLQRIHSPEEGEEAVEIARSAGFENVSFDLMFAIPGQTKESWEYSLNKAISIRPDHISAYSLIYEKNTPLYKDLILGKVKAHNTESDAEMYQMAMDLIRAAGYHQYEVANYALGGKKCLHNLNYWYGGEYISFGPSAHGFINGKRYWNFRHLPKYTSEIESDRLPIENQEDLQNSEVQSERILLELRAEGLNLERFSNRFGFRLEDCAKSLIFELQKNDLIRLGGGILSLTKQGYLLADEIALRLIESKDSYI